MVARVTIYGYVVPPPDHIHGEGSGSLVDLVYFLNDPAIERMDPDILVKDIFRMIKSAGYRIIGKHVGNIKSNPLEAPRITIENWDEHLKVGVEKSAAAPQNPETGYDRYNPPPVI